MGLFDSIVAAAGGYKDVDRLLKNTIFDGYQEFQNNSDYIALFKYPDDIIVKRSYEILKEDYSTRWGRGIRYTDNMTKDEIKTLKDLLNMALDLPEIVRVIRSRVPKLDSDHGPCWLVGGIGGTWYLGAHKYDPWDAANEIDPADVAFVRSLGFPI